jgi:glycosyltransferase involved in cell wall biosynthesis
VVVPAHDEEALLPACLAALRRTASALHVPVRLLVVADRCGDRTADVARAGGAQVISIQARRVGAARAAGMTELLRLTSGTDPSAIWLATTDADTVVPPGWLRRQLDYADAGWDVVLGTVTITDWDGHPAHVPVAFAERLLRTAPPSCARRESRHPGLCLPGRRRVPAAAHSRRPHAARRGDGGWLRGRAGARHHGRNLGPPMGTRTPRLQQPAADPG